MYEIAFPKMLTQNSTLLVEDNKAVLQNLRLLLLSQKGTLFGDPYYGTSLRKYLYNQNDTILKDLVIDAIYMAIIDFMPEIIIERKNINVEADRANLVVNLKFSIGNNLTYDLYTLKLNSDELL